jgi:hypothetical protein
MNSENKVEIIFQEKIKDIEIINTIQGIITDVTNESLTMMLQDGKIIIISTKCLVEIKEWKKYDPID